MSVADQELVCRSFVADDDVQVSVAVRVSKAIAYVDVNKLRIGYCGEVPIGKRAISVADQQLVWRVVVADDDVKCPSPFTSRRRSRTCLGCRRSPDRQTRHFRRRSTAGLPHCGCLLYNRLWLPTTTSKCPSPVASKAIVRVSAAAEEVLIGNAPFPSSINSWFAAPSGAVSSVAGVAVKCPSPFTSPRRLRMCVAASRVLIGKCAISVNVNS